MPREYFPENVLDDIEILIARADKLAGVMSFSDYTGVGIYGLGRRMAGDLGLSPSEARELLNAISRLCQFRDMVEDEPTTFIERLTGRLERHAPEEWKVKHLEEWKANAPKVTELIVGIGDDHPLVIARKAQELTYSHQNILTESRLITDVRPVFDSKGEVVRDFVITHMLSLEYTDGTQKQTTLTVAMDALDVQKLLAQCERVSTKILTLKRELKDFNTIVMPDLDEKEG